MTEDQREQEALGWLAAKENGIALVLQQAQALGKQWSGWPP